MTKPSPDSRAQRSATRAPVGRPINLQFDDSLNVVDGLCENISIGGMFIQVANTRSPGSLVRFELQIDDNIAIRGLGEVVWIRAKNAAAKAEAGIGIKFRFLEQRDRQLIFKLVSQHIKERLAKQQPASGGAPPEPPAPLPPPAAPPSPDASTVTAPMIASPDGTPRVVDVVVDDGSPQDPAFDLDDDEPTVIGQRRKFEEPMDDEPTVIGQRRPTFEADAPPASSETPSPTVSFVDAAPPPAPLPTASPEPFETDSFDAELAQLRGAPGMGADDGSVDRELDRGGSRPAEPRRAAQAPFDNLLDRDPSAAIGGAVREDSVVARYDLGSSGSGRPRWPIAAVVVVLALAAAGYAFKDRFLGGEDPVERAFNPPSDPSAAEPAAEPPAGTAAGSPETAPPPASRPAASTPPPPPPPAARRPASANARFSKIVDIRWGPRSGGLRVVVEADGPISGDRYSHFRLDGGSPREVIRFLGVSSPYSSSEIAVGNLLLRQIRTGFHRKGGGNELHVVLDLANGRARVSDIQARGNQLEILIAGR